MDDIQAIINDLLSTNPTTENIVTFKELLANSSPEKITKIVVDKILPNLFKSDNTKIRKEVLHLIIECKNIEAKHLNKKDAAKFKLLCKQDFVDDIDKLRIAENSDWSILCVTLFRILGTVLHNDVDIINRILRIVENGFRNKSIDQKCEAYECWKELIRNYSLVPSYMKQLKQMKLLIKPLKVPLSRQACVVEIRFDTFLLLLESLTTDAVNIYSDFLQFVFHIGNVTKCESTVALASYKTIWPKSAAVLFQSLGCEGDIEPICQFNTKIRPIIDCKYFESYYKLLVYSARVCSELTYQWCCKLKTIYIITPIWQRIFELSNKSSLEKSILLYISEHITQLFQHASTNNYFTYNNILIPILEIIYNNPELNTPLYRSDFVLPFLRLYQSHTTLHMRSRNETIAKLVLFVYGAYLPEFCAIFDSVDYSEVMEMIWCRCNDAVVLEVNKMAKFNLLTYLKWPIRSIKCLHTTGCVLKLWKSTVVTINQFQSDFVYQLLDEFRLLQAKSSWVVVNMMIVAVVLLEIAEKQTIMMECVARNITECLQNCAVDLEQFVLYKTDFFPNLKLLVQIISKNATILATILQSVDKFVDNMPELIIKSIPNDFILFIEELSKSTNSTAALSLVIKLKPRVIHSTPTGISRGKKMACLNAENSPKTSNCKHRSEKLTKLTPNIDESKPINNFEGKITKKTNKLLTNTRTKNIMDFADDVFVRIDKKVTPDFRRMSSQQRDATKRRRDDIPALYCDLSQSQSQISPDMSVKNTESLQLLRQNEHIGNDNAITTGEMSDSVPHNISEAFINKKVNCDGKMDADVDVDAVGSARVRSDKRLVKGISNANVGDFWNKEADEDVEKESRSSAREENRFSQQSIDYFEKNAENNECRNKSSTKKGNKIKQMGKKKSNEDRQNAFKSTSKSLKIIYTKNSKTNKLRKSKFSAKWCKNQQNFIKNNPLDVQTKQPTFVGNKIADTSNSLEEQLELPEQSPDVILATQPILAERVFVPDKLKYELNRLRMDIVGGDLAGRVNSKRIRKEKIDLSALNRHKKNRKRLTLKNCVEMDVDVDEKTTDRANTNEYLFIADSDLRKNNLTDVSCNSEQLICDVTTNDTNKQSECLLDTTKTSEIIKNDLKQHNASVLVQFHHEKTISEQLNAAAPSTVRHEDIISQLKTHFDFLKQQRFAKIENTASELMLNVPCSISAQENLILEDVKQSDCSEVNKNIKMTCESIVEPLNGDLEAFYKNNAPEIASEHELVVPKDILTLTDTTLIKIDDKTNTIDKTDKIVEPLNGDLEAFYTNIAPEIVGEHELVVPKDILTLTDTTPIKIDDKTNTIDKTDKTVSLLSTDSSSTDDQSVIIATQPLDSLNISFIGPISSSIINDIQNKDTLSINIHELDTETCDSNVPTTTTTAELNALIPSSPVTNTTPNKNKTLLDDTQNISPIATVLNAVASPDLFDSEKALVEKRRVDDDVVEVGRQTHLNNTVDVLCLAPLMKVVSVASPKTHRIQRMMQSLEERRSGVESVDCKEVGQVNYGGGDLLEFSADLPRADARPRTPSILKRKAPDYLDDGLSPVSKRKRVNFSDPPTTSSKVYLKSDEEHFIQRVLKKTGKLSMKPRNPNNPTDMVFNIKVNIKNNSDAQLDSCLDATKITTTESDSVSGELSDLYPELIDCPDDIDSLLYNLTADIKQNGIRTIGDLVRLKRAEINDLPIAEPKFTRLNASLSEYCSKYKNMTYDIDGVDKIISVDCLEKSISNVNIINNIILSRKQFDKDVPSGLPAICQIIKSNIQQLVAEGYSADVIGEQLNNIFRSCDLSLSVNLPYY